GDSGFAPLFRHVTLRLVRTSVATFPHLAYCFHYLLVQNMLLNLPEKQIPCAERRDYRSEAYAESLRIQDILLNLLHMLFLAESAAHANSFLNILHKSRWYC
ncbi:hypothetical protein CEXT_538431, partial [Caerostris extrusa]